MEFLPQREFFHPHVNTKLKRKSTADNVILVDDNDFRYLYQAMFLLLLNNFCSLVYLMVGCSTGRKRIWSRNTLSIKVKIPNSLSSMHLLLKFTKEMLNV